MKISKRSVQSLKRYIQYFGTTTGMPCANQVANLFLLGIDLLALSAFKHVFFLKRYLDDLLVCYSADGVDDDDDDAVEKARLILSDWNDHITLTSDASENGSQVHFLDLSISVDNNGAIRHSNYWKPLNSFMYTPWSSIHSPATKIGIVLGELNRLKTNCDDVSDFLKCVSFLRSKLIARGYPAQFLDDCELRFNTKQQQNRNYSISVRCKFWC